MSVKIMGMVWDADLPRNQKMILLAYADHADHEGRNIFPSVGRIAWKTGYSERAVQQITRELETAGILILDGTGPIGTNRFHIEVEALPERTDYGGAKIAPSPAEIAPGGAEFAPGGVQKTAKGGADSAPESSYNRQLEPSVEEGYSGPSWKLPDALDSESFGEAWFQWFMHYREQTGNNLSSVQGELLLGELAHIGADRAIAAIEHSIKRGWKSIHEPDRVKPRPGAPSANGAEAAWAIVEQALRRGDGTTLKEHAGVLQAIDAAGGWPRFKNASEHELQFARRDFLGAYHE